VSLFIGATIGNLRKHLISFHFLMWTGITGVRFNAEYAYKGGLYQILGVELVYFAAFFTHFPRDDKIGRWLILYKLLMNKKDADKFNKYLLLMVTNRSEEPSFSKLKFIKFINRLRATINHLWLMSMEYSIFTDINFDKMIKDFVKCLVCNSLFCTICLLLLLIMTGLLIC